MFKVTCWIFIFYLYLLEHIVEFCFHDFLSMYEGPEVYQFIIRQSSLLFLKFYNQHSWASWGCSSMNGSCKCNEHSPSPIQQSKKEIKSLVLLWPLSHLPSHIVWFRYPLHLLIPPVCPSQPTNKWSYLNIRDTQVPAVKCNFPPSLRDLPQSCQWEGRKEQDRKT